MDQRNLAKKLAPVAIVIVVILLVFAVRAETINIGGVSDPSQKELYQDDSGMPYFTEIDSYYNYRLTENYLETGHLGDTVVNGTDWDSLSTSPNGREADYQPLIIMLAAWTYTFLNSFMEVSLTQVAFWLGPAVASLAVIPAFIMVKRSTNSTCGATVAALIVGLAPAYFSHTYGGFFDTDMFNVLLPLLITLFLTESVYARKTPYKVLYAVISALCLGLFSMAWSGYAYMVLLTFGALLLYLPVSYLVDRKDGREIPSIIEWLKNNPVTITLIVFYIVSAIVLAITVGGSMFETISSTLGMSISLQSATAGSAYPNVYVSVGEMQVPDVIDIINESGGVFTILYAIGGIGILAYVLRKKAVNKSKETIDTKAVTKTEDKKVRSKRYTPKTKKADELKEEVHKHKFIPGRFEYNQDEKYNQLFMFVLLLLWICGLAIMLTQGTRFIEQFSVPVALLSGIFVGISIKYVDLKTEQKSYVTIIALVLLVLAVVSPLYADHTTSSSSVGSTNDDMYNALTWIKENTAENTVIASWWDYGHLFTQVADRQVVFDGGSQNNMRAYWIGNALQTSNEDLSAGILRMLANSGEEASDTLDLYTNDTGTSVAILNEILPMDKDTARSTLTGTYGLTEQEANSVVDLTHPDDTKPVVLLLSSDMLSKASWWSYFGTWDFENQNATHYTYYSALSTAEEINGKAFILGEDNGVVGVESDNTNDTNGTGMTFAYIDQTKLNKSINMSNQTDKEQWASELTDGTGSSLIKPHKLIYVEDNQLSERIVNENSNMSIMVIKQSDGSYYTILFDSYLEDSVFTKLYLESGYNTTRFNLTHTESGISVWNVYEYANTSTTQTNTSNQTT
ncbi:MAG: dolichyl-diphosphooligosaccharide--protein glycosyltransferase subunit STT3 [Methanosphaera sp.]|nr:dolichyl-diphosphooligosaccharide--protein glycosyltransferase subunit STT3 [Methanosphaera sp.]